MTEAKIEKIKQDISNCKNRDEYLALMEKVNAEFRIEDMKAIDNPDPSMDYEAMFESIAQDNSK